MEKKIIIKNNNILRILIILLILTTFFVKISYAHPGRTDSNGGHWDHSTGTYHYHSGEYAGQSTSKNSTSQGYTTQKENVSTFNNTTTKTSTKNENKDSNLSKWIAIILFILLFILPIAIEIIKLIIEAIKHIFNKNKAKTNIPTKPATYTVSSQYTCPKCGNKLVIKNGRYGKFIGCSHYPYCKYTKNIKKQS